MGRNAQDSEHLFSQRKRLLTPERGCVFNSRHRILAFEACWRSLRSQGKDVVSNHIAAREGAGLGVRAGAFPLAFVSQRKPDAALACYPLLLTGNWEMFAQT